ncbi:MAG: PilZ domain-containing protein [Oceanicaulis sp.]|jgi:methyl-accepting chemotaxis protein|nr:PilZ domain-containing protein [Oceanicaulis sp.]
MRWSDLKLSIKLPALIVGFALLGMAAVAVASTMTASQTVAHLSEDRLMAVANARANELERYFIRIKSDLHSVAVDPGLAEAIDAFDTAFSELAAQGSATDTLKDAYIRNNPNPLGEKHLLDAAATGTAYDAAHARYHPWMRTHLEESGYYDIFLFNTAGDLIYSVFKEEDYATNFSRNGGEWSDSDLGQAFRDALALQDGQFSFYDFSPYAPSHGAPASFMAMPVFDNGVRVGVLAFQMPIDGINTIMSDASGLGETGEALIVGQDGLLRSDSRYTADSDILQSRLEMEAVTDTLSTGAPSLADRSDFQDRRVGAATAAFDFGGVRWAVIALQDVSERDAPIWALVGAIAIVLLLACVVIGAAGLWASRTLTGPLGRVNQALEAVTSGHLVQIADRDVSRKDEIGGLARAVQEFKKNQEMQKAMKAEQAKRADMDKRRQVELEHLIREFETHVAQTMELVTREVGQMSANADAVNGTAEQASNGASSSARASEQASQAVSSVSAAAQELVASIAEIARQTETARDVVEQTVTLTDGADAQIKQLSEAAQKIGAILNLINDIAEQTNLLALNATIEAARAGEAGKGFAVVAQEVKALAEQTSKATGEIATQITSVQTSTDGAVGALGDISESIRKVSEISNAIASAIEEQNAVTSEISSSITLASEGTEQSARESGQVAASIAETSEIAGSVRHSAETVSGARSQLASTISDFLSSVSQDLEDRRADQRFEAVQAVVITKSGKQVDAILRDISLGGVRVEPPIEVSVGDQVEICFPTGEQIASKVVHVDSSYCGLAFVEKLRVLPGAAAA